MIMNNIIKKIAVSGLFLMIALSSFGQKYKLSAADQLRADRSFSYRQAYSFNWMTSVPVGATASFLPQTSFNGASLGYTYFLNERIGFGFDISWSYSTLYKAPEEYISDNVAIYASTKRMLQNFPIKVQAKYMLTPNSLAKVYVAAGIGAINTQEIADIQDIEFWDNTWGFLMSPEVGALIPFGSNSTWGAEIVAGYNWGTNTVGLGTDVERGFSQNLYFEVGLYIGIF